MRLKRHPGTRLGEGTGAAFHVVDAALAGNVPAEDIARLEVLVRDGTLVAAATSAIGALRGVGPA